MLPLWRHAETTLNHSQFPYLLYCVCVFQRRIAWTSCRTEASWSRFVRTVVSTTGSSAWTRTCRRSAGNLLPKNHTKPEVSTTHFYGQSTGPWPPIQGSFTLQFFLISTAILLIARNGLYRTQWKCSHYATATTSPSPIYPIVSRNKSQLQSEKNAQCEWAF